MARLIDIVGKPLTGEWGLDDDTGKGIPVLRTTNFTNEGVIDFSNVVTRTIAKENLSEKLLRDGDIIIEKSGGSDKQPVGRVVFFEGESKKYLFNNFTGLLRVKEPEHWLPRYVFYSLFARYRFGGTLRYENRTTGLHNLQIDAYINSIEIADLAINQQQRICNILDEVQRIVFKRKQQLSALDDLIKARFVEMMENAVLSGETTVGNITERVKVGFVGTCEKYYTDESGIPMLRTGNITENGVDLSDLKYVTEEFHNKNKKSQIHFGDLLIARHGSNGQANVYYGSEAQCLNAVIIVPNQEIASSVFLAGLINSPMVKKQINKTLVGSTQHVINTKSVAGLSVRIPKMSVQKEYEDFVSQIDKTESAIQKSLTETQLLFDSLMQKYFG